MSRKIFINLPIKDLDRSVEFFSKLGFTFNQQFTDKNATCMVIGDNIFAMLLVEPFFKTFTKKELADTTKTIEVINAISVDSKKEVDEIIEKALKAGAIEPRPAQDYGWMFARSFTDLDNHFWEVFYMDESNAPKNP